MAALDRIRSCVLTRWKDMRREFRHADPGASGIIDSDQLRQTLRNNRADLGEDEFAELLDYFDRGRMDKINYNDFIRYFF